MAKGAASGSRMAQLHSKVALVMIRVLETYLKNLDELDNRNLADTDEDDLIAAALDAENLMPSPAMLSAITNFLKHNDITFEEEQVDKLRDLKDTLEDRRNSRRKRIADVPVMGEC